MLSHQLNPFHCSQAPRASETHFPTACPATMFTVVKPGHRCGVTTASLTAHPLAACIPVPDSPIAVPNEERGDVGWMQRGNCSLRRWFGAGTAAQSRGCSIPGDARSHRWALGSLRWGGNEPTAGLRLGGREVPSKPTIPWFCNH